MPLDGPEAVALEVLLAEEVHLPAVAHEPRGRHLEARTRAVLLMLQLHLELDGSHRRRVSCSAGSLRCVEQLLCTIALTRQHGQWIGP